MKVNVVLNTPHLQLLSKVPWKLYLEFTDEGSVVRQISDNDESMCRSGSLLPGVVQITCASTWRLHGLWESLHLIRNPPLYFIRGKVVELVTTLV